MVNDHAGLACPPTENAGTAATRPFVFNPALLGDLDTDPAAREAEWRRVYEHFDPRLREFFRFQVQDSEALDALVAHVWRAALRGFSRLASPRAAWSYLTTVGKNYLRDEWRAARRWHRAIDAYAVHMQVEAELHRSAASVLDKLEREEQTAGGTIKLEALEERMTQLSDEDRRLLHLRHVQDLTHEEAARVIGIEPAAMRKRYSRVLAYLRA